MPDAAKITTIEAFICHEWCKPLWFVGLLFSINFTVFSAFCLFHFFQHHKQHKKAAQKKETRTEEMGKRGDLRRGDVQIDVVRRRLYAPITTRRRLIFSSVSSILLEQSGTLNFSFLLP